MTTCLSSLGAGLALLALLAPSAYAAEPAAPVPIAHFFEHAAFTGAVLAPDARSLAVVIGSATAREKLVVIDLVNNKAKAVAQFSRADIGRVEWVNNERLVYTSEDKSIAPGDARFAPGVYAVNRDGSNYLQLVDVYSDDLVEHKAGARLLSPDHYLVGLHNGQDGNDVYLYHPKFSAGGTGDFIGMQLVKVDTSTGRSSIMPRPGTTQSWLMDHQGTPRLAVTLDQSTEAIHYLDPATKAWRKVSSYDGYVGGPGAFLPLAFAPDGTLYVASYAHGDKAALHTFDFKTGKPSAAPVMALEGFDFHGSLVSTHDKLLGIRYLSDARATVWFDEPMKKVQAAVDALRPHTVNLIEVAARAELPLVLVVSYADRQPHQYALYNTATGKLNPVGETQPNIDPARMGAQELVRVKTRDGLSVPTWLTLPNGRKGKNLPMVVLVHGGPYVRGTEWGWSANAQFLASRGYAVLEPEFRGSTGYGSQWYRAGWKQWGLAMQNDIADATRWAIKEGIADPQRICIAGASYGGYATLMGLVNDPDLYKCGINWAGVTDIKLLYTGDFSFQSDVSDGFKQYGMPTLVGDLVKDAAQLAATSPLLQASRIKQPVLMAYGAADQRVPLHHGKLFFNAVKAGNPQAELVVYPNEGHGWTLPATSIDFWGRVETFLHTHIGPKK